MVAATAVFQRFYLFLYGLVLSTSAPLLIPVTIASLEARCSISD